MNRRGRRPQKEGTATGSCNLLEFLYLSLQNWWQCPGSKGSGCSSTVMFLPHGLVDWMFLSLCDQVGHVKYTKSQDLEVICNWRL